MIITCRLKDKDDYKYRFLQKKGINVSRYVAKCIDRLYSDVLQDTVDYLNSDLFLVNSNSLSINQNK